jgi:hypothetical protein
MMTLHLKKCVSSFLCLSLLLSACSPGKSHKASEFTTRPTTRLNKKVKVLNNTPCGDKREIFVEVGETIEYIGGMKCITKKDSDTIICTNTKNSSKCELTDLKLCDHLGKHCKVFKLNETPVPCNKSSNTPKGECPPGILTGKSKKYKKEEKKEQETNNNGPTGWSTAKKVGVGVGVVGGAGVGVGVGTTMLGYGEYNKIKAETKRQKDAAAAAKAEAEAMEAAKAEYGKKWYLSDEQQKPPTLLLPPPAGGGGGKLGKMLAGTGLMRHGQFRLRRSKTYHEKIICLIEILLGMGIAGGARTINAVGNVLHLRTQQPQPQPQLQQTDYEEAADRILTRVNMLLETELTGEERVLLRLELTDELRRRQWAPSIHEELVAAAREMFPTINAWLEPRIYREAQIERYITLPWSVEMRPYLNPEELARAKAEKQSREDAEYAALNTDAERNEYLDKHPAPPPPPMPKPKTKKDEKK